MVSGHQEFKPTERKIKWVRVGIWFNTGEYVLCKSPEKNVRLSTKTRIGWNVVRLGMFMMFGAKTKDWKTLIDPLETEI